jgi:signal transduction histidine kinase
MAALVIYRFDPMEIPAFRLGTLSLIFIYAFYSLILYLASLWQPRSLNHQILLWVDILWITSVIILRHGSSSFYFIFYYFAILSASFREDLTPGMRVVWVCSLFYFLICMGDYLLNHDLEFDRFLIRITCLLAFGYMIAYRGQFEIARKNRLSLYNEISLLPNPRFGVDRFVALVMERLLHLYKADSCLLLLKGEGDEEYQLRMADRSHPERGGHAETIPAEFAAYLLKLPDNLAIAYNGRSRSRWRWKRSVYAFPVQSKERAPHERGGLPSPEQEKEFGEKLAVSLDAASYVTVPIYHYEEYLGRLYLISESYLFNDTDASFLLDVLRFILPLMDHIRLVDNLASEAAEQERQRIARDIHDRVIQPYIGLHFGLSALHRKIKAHTLSVEDIERLMEMADGSIEDIRTYTRQLKNEVDREEGLASALRRFADRFHQATGVQVDFEIGKISSLTGRLTAEVFQMIVEGLSNVRRHTLANYATIGLSERQDNLVLTIKNGPWETANVISFTPKSIAGRAEALGGQHKVVRHVNGISIVEVTIPL